MIGRILVFPCGSEVGLEIHRSLRFSTHFELIGASSVQDHGRFVFDRYVGGLPFHTAADFAPRLGEIVKSERVDAIYPAMDSVAVTVSGLGAALGIRVIGSSARAAAICASKRLTYELLEGAVPVPEVFPSARNCTQFPVFVKPDRGYGSRGTFKATSLSSLMAHLGSEGDQSLLVTEYLPGPEWTVDCFSDRHGQLRFFGPRCRARISNGISVSTKPSQEWSDTFGEWAAAINRLIRPRGAWFFQAKLDATGKPKLLEVAARLGGSSGLFRCKGVNFALLSAFDAFDMDVDVLVNSYGIELDRALESRYSIDVAYDKVYVDLDDCLIVRGRPNLQLVGFLFKARSEGRRLILLTRHACNPAQTLALHGLGEVFHQIIHLDPGIGGQSKSDFVEHSRAIFIDDSFAERKEVALKCGIPTFSPDMIEALF